MEDVTVLFIVLAVCMCVTVIALMIVRERAEDRRERRRRSQPAREARHPPRGGPEESGELGAWVPELLESFSVDPEVLFDDEMPEELRALLPMARAFIQSGGLGKLLQGNQGVTPGTPPEEAYKEI
jgi:hypothetical protein